MTTTATRPASGSSRRSPTTAPSPNPPPSSIMRGATARSAVSPRVSSSLNGAAARRASLKGAVSPPPASAHQTRDALSESLKQETEQKEKLLVQLQDKDQTIATLKTENDGLSSALNAAESRLGDLYAEQSRMEDELAARIEVIDKLRSQVRELEKEKRDVHRRYNEQTATFEAERQAFYDNEQHLKSRIQSLSQIRRQPPPPPPLPASPSVVSVVESEAEPDEAPAAQESIDQDARNPDQEPAEMTALKLELSTLSTSHTSLQATVALLQSQLIDLKRVNNELQEENESYNILLREKTLSGQYDVLKMGGAAQDEDTSSDEGKDADSYMSRNTGRSTLDRVEELSEPEQDEEHEPHAPLDPEFDQADIQEHSSQDDTSLNNKSTRSRHGRKRSSVTAPRGESLANLPITGPGLDLAAELGRAENKDMLDGATVLDDRANISNPKTRRHKKGANSEPGRKASNMSLMETSASWNDIDALRSEVKSLKDANKALSLYASKIIDRIISQDGFEHVLAADYEKPPPTPVAATTAQPVETASKSTKPRPLTMFVSPVSPGLQQEKLTTFESLREKAPPTPVTATATTTTLPPMAISNPPASSSRASRRSLSFDWRGFSVFGGNEKKPDPPANLRPLTLKAGTPVVTGARKLDNQEDEEDRRERERLHATMKLMGIDKSTPTPPTSPLPPMLKNMSEPPASVVTATNTPATATAPTPTSRFSFFRRQSSMAASSTSSVNSAQNSPQPPAAATPNLTQEALERAEAESSIAALEAHERKLSADIAKGAGSGFTEIVRRSGDKRSSRRSHSGSGSTVWSAGMSRHEDDD